MSVQELLLFENSQKYERCMEIAEKAFESGKDKKRMVWLVGENYGLSARDNGQVFKETEGGIDSLTEFALSAAAHNGIVVNDLNYAIPSYTDFTVMDSADERSESVTLTMSHNRYEGVTLKRRFMWIKPNIIVLYDEAESCDEHKYTQNFILQNWAVNKKDKTKATVSVTPKFTVTITQFAADDADFELEVFNGTANTNDEANYRGSLISGMIRLKKGCNLAYSKKGSRVRFLTAIELHSASEGISEQGKRTSSVRINFDKLTVTLENGTEICEKGLAELEAQMSERLSTQGEAAANTETTIPGAEIGANADINGKVDRNDETGRI